MPWVRTGTCNQCGQCCKSPVIDSQVMMSKTQPDWCKYLSMDGDLYICLITAGKFDTPTSKEPEIPQEDYDYWLRECQTYPDPDNPAHTSEREHELPEKCGFTIVDSVSRRGV